MNKEDYIQHYASEYYDPVKAHQYYEEHKKLKGRHSTKGFSDKQKEAWIYAKATLQEEKKTKSEATRTERTNTVASHRENAEKVREQIRKKIEDAINKITEQATSEKESLKALTIPKGASKSQKQQIREENARRSEERSKVSENTKNDKALTRNAGSEERSQLSASLKSLISDTRTKCTEKIEQIKKDYETKLDNEYNNISKYVK